MSWRGELRKAGVDVTVGAGGVRDWVFSGQLTARNLITRFAGKHFHVHSGDGSNASGFGGSRTKPFASINYCFSNASVTANNGDVIWVHAGHTETVIAAGGLDLDIAGVTLVFLGDGTNRATITFTTDVGADMDVDAANITMINPRFLAGIDALTGPIDVNAARFKIVDGEYSDAAADGTTDCIVATAAATGLFIDGWRYIESTTGTQKESNIQLNGVDNLILRNIDIRGDFNAGCIENVTDECLNIRLDTIMLENLNADPSPGMVLDSNCDGHATGVQIRVASGTTYLSDVSDINWGADCLGFSTDGGAGEPLGTTISTGIEGKIDIIDAFHDVPTADSADNVVISDVLGNKTDTNAGDSLYSTQLAPTADVATDVYARDTIGRKTDAAAAGAVSAVESLMAYAKQNVTEGIARDVKIDDLDDLKEEVVVSTTAVLANGTTIFTVAGGMIKIESLVSECITTGDGGAATLQYSADPTVGAAGTISGATGSVATAVAGSTATLVGTALSTAPLFSVTGPNLIANPGTVIIPAGIITTVIGGAASTATWKHILRYKPLEAGVTVS